MDRAGGELAGAELAAVESFIADTQFRLHQLMKAKGISRSQLAEMLGVRKSRVSAMFSGNTNITLHTLGRMLYVLGERGELSSPTINRRLADLCPKDGVNVYTTDTSMEAERGTAADGVHSTRRPESSAAEVMRVLKVRNDLEWRPFVISNYNSNRRALNGVHESNAA